MVLTDQEKAAIRHTQATPGWEIIKKVCEQRIEAAKIDALGATNEEAFVKVYRHLQATGQALNLFTAELEAEIQEPNEHNPEY